MCYVYVYVLANGVRLNDEARPGLTVERTRWVMQIYQFSCPRPTRMAGQAQCMTRKPSIRSLPRKSSTQSRANFIATQIFFFITRGFTMWPYYMVLLKVLPCDISTWYYNISIILLDFLYFFNIVSSNNI